jgi:hypothetical protein
MMGTDWNMLQGCSGEFVYQQEAIYLKFYHKNVADGLHSKIIVVPRSLVSQAGQLMRRALVADAA